MRINRQALRDIIGDDSRLIFDNISPGTPHRRPGPSPQRGGGAGIPPLHRGGQRRFAVHP